jgi:hypothetical protein
MQEIHVRHYTHPQETHYDSFIEPEDRAWILFVPVAGPPQLFLRVQNAGTPLHLPGEVFGEEHKTEYSYVAAGC